MNSCCMRSRGKRQAGKYVVRRARTPRCSTAAAWLHDLGYAPDIRDTGFHPLDGAGLAAQVPVSKIASERLSPIIPARTSRQRNAALPKAQGFPRETSLVADALLYAEMTRGPMDRISPSAQGWMKSSPVTAKATASRVSSSERGLSSSKRRSALKYSWHRADRALWGRQALAFEGGRVSFERSAELRPGYP